MAIALVSAGPLSIVSATTVTPAFGQSTTAGNFLVARVAGGNSTTPVIATTAAGWTVINTSANTTAIAYKPNCGISEAAPTFTFDGGSHTLYADLMEFSGVASSSPKDQSGESTSGAIAATTAVDTGAGELAVLVYTATDTKSATWTITDSWTPAGGSVPNSHGSGSTKALTVAWMSSYITTSNSTADTDTLTVTPSTGLVQTQYCQVVSFLVATPASRSLIYDDRRILRNSLLRR